MILTFLLKDLLSHNTTTSHRCVLVLLKNALDSHRQVEEKIGEHVGSATERYCAEVVYMRRNEGYISRMSRLRQEVMATIDDLRIDVGLLETKIAETLSIVETQRDRVEYLRAMAEFEEN